MTGSWPEHAAPGRQSRAEPTSRAELDRSLTVLAESARSFARSPVAEKAAWVRQILGRYYELCPRMVADACHVKGVAEGSALEGEEWFAGPLVTLRSLRQLAVSLDQIAKRGAPELAAERVRPRANGGVAVRTVPHDRADGVLFTPYASEAWLDARADTQELAASQASFYQQREPEGRVVLVLGAGNVASIPILDAIYKLFVEGSVCLLKMSPVNDYLGASFELACAPLIERGFLRICYGGAEVGAYLCGHELVQEIHMTGSADTHDAIVWGPAGPEREARKRTGTPLLRKTVTSELGNVSPVLVVPGRYSEAEIELMARGIAGMITQNASFNCNAAKMLIVPKGSLRDALLGRLRTVLSGIPPRKAYYPGAEARYRALTTDAPRVETFGAAGAGELPWTLVSELDAAGAAPQFRQEPFCSIVSAVVVGGEDPLEFLDAAVQFANEKLWGTLNAMLYVSPALERDPSVAPRLERALDELRYGTVAVNQWPAASYALATPPWGGHPSATLSDVQSGIGWVHNTLFLEHVEKTVQRGPLRAFPTPMYFPGHRKLRELGRALCDFEMRPNAWNLARIAAAATRA
ncbi:MAG TPA: aldehyde dehydrogenase family protein [Polyangiaceae bacterium]|jgi:aldehyde dehydrogenase (NAD(P)+)